MGSATSEPKQHKPEQGKSTSIRKKENDPQNDVFEKAKKNTLQTFLIVALCFVLCLCQNQTLFFMYNMGYKLDWNSTYYIFTVLLLFVNCTVNPFIYLVKYQDFQIALREFFGCKGQQTQQGSSVSSVSTVSAL